MQRIRLICTDRVPPLLCLQDLPLTQTITSISNSLSVYFKAFFTLQVLRISLMFVAVSVRQSLFHFNAFLYDYVTVLVFYLISSSCVYILLGVLGVCAAVTLRRWMFFAVSIPNVKQLLRDTDGQWYHPRICQAYKVSFILILYRVIQKERMFFR